MTTATGSGTMKQGSARDILRSWEKLAKPKKQERRGPITEAEKKQRRAVFSHFGIDLKEVPKKKSEEEKKEG